MRVFVFCNTCIQKKSGITFHKSPKDSSLKLWLKEIKLLIGFPTDMMIFINHPHTETVVLNISDMIDLAIGTPEVGTVDFNMLQTVLHCLAQQQQVLEKTVEVRGVSIPHQRDSSNVQTVNVQEFAVGTDGSPPVQKQRKSATADTILVVERMKKTDSPTQMKPAPQTAQAAAQAAVTPPAPSPAPGAAGTAGAAGVAGAAGAPGSAAAEAAGGFPPGLEGLSLVTYSKFNLLENTVNDIKNRVYGSIPKNQEILEEVRSQTNIKAIQDMWQNLNVSARLEAAETGIEKLSSLVQDIINENTALQDKVANAAALAGEAQQAGSAKATPSTTSAAPPPPGTTPSALAAKSTIVASPSTTDGGIAPTASKADLANLQDLVDKLQGDLNSLAEAFNESLKQMAAGADTPEAKAKIEEIMAPKPTATPSRIGPDTSATDGGESKGRAKRSVRTDGEDGGGGGMDINVVELMERMNDFEKRLEECQKDLAKCTGGVQDQLTSFQDQLEYISKQMGTLSSMTSGSLSPELIKDLQGLMQLFQTVQDMKAQLAQVHDTALQLAAEKDDRKHHINVLLEQIDMLKTIKLDREDMAEAMAEKADLRMLARKVSHDQFELACDDLSRGLEHALGKLNMQEALWQQALDDIQREIETKLDKMELSPVKEFFNSKLKMLQESLKQMASLRREAEAAGTKRKLLRDVNCLSCDANAVMPMEAPPSIPVPKPFPGTLSMKPYLSYELDTIRKAQASHLPQRNMHDWENIDKMAQQPKQQKVRTSADRHLCNRYCGGSHTTTTPAQRVARLGHFIKQWGPDVLPLSSGFAAGDDGRMYRISPDGTKVPAGGAGEMSIAKAQKKPENTVITERYVGDDCKCMESPPPGVQFSAKGK